MSSIRAVERMDWNRKRGTSTEAEVETEKTGTGKRSEGRVVKRKELRGVRELEPEG